MASTSATASVLDNGMQAMPYVDAQGNPALFGMVPEGRRPARTHACCDPSCARCLATAGLGSMAQQGGGVQGGSGCGGGKSSRKKTKASSPCGSAGQATPCCDDCASDGDKTHVCTDLTCPNCLATAQQLQGDWPVNTTGRGADHCCADPTCARCAATAQQLEGDWNFNSEKPRRHVCLDPDCARCKATAAPPVETWGLGYNGPGGKHGCVDPNCARCSATAQQLQGDWSSNSEKKRPHVCLEPDCTRCKATARNLAPAMEFSNPGPRTHACMEPDCERCLATAQPPTDVWTFENKLPTRHGCVDPDCGECSATARNLGEGWNWDSSRPKMHVCGDYDCETCKATARPPPEPNWDSSKPKMHVCGGYDCERCKATAQQIVSPLFGDLTLAAAALWEDLLSGQSSALAGYDSKKLAADDLQTFAEADGTNDGREVTCKTKLTRQVTPADLDSADKIPVEYTTPLTWMMPDASSPGSPPVVPGALTRWRQVRLPIDTTSCADDPDEPSTGCYTLNRMSGSYDCDGSVADKLRLTCSPIVVGDWLVFGVHYQKCLTSTGDSRDLPYRNTLLGLYLPDAQTDPKIYVLNSDGGDTEATLYYDPERCLVYWPHVLDTHLEDSEVPVSAVTVVDAVDFSTVARLSRLDGGHDTMLAGIDSSGVGTDIGYVFGTTNRPTAACNNAGGESTSCGAVMAATLSGSSFTVTGQMDYGTDKFRTWVGGSVSADSYTLGAMYVGGTSQYGWDPAGGSDGTGGVYHNDYTHALHEDRRGCSVTQVVPDEFADIGLRASSAFDPGELNCETNSNDFKSAVAGEVVVQDSDTLWAQFTASNYAAGSPIHDTFQVYAINTSNMQAICEFLMPGATATRKGAGFHMAPTVDSSGNGYAIFNLEDGSQVNARLMVMPPRPDQNCRVYLSDVMEDQEVFHSPTLLSGPEGEYVAVVTDKTLYLFDQKSASAPVFELDHHAGVPYSACPVFHDGALYLLSEGGHVSILPSPLRDNDRSSYVEITGYGTAIWPRFRADNCGTGRPDGDDSVCRP